MFVLLPPKLTKNNDTMAILRSVYGSGFVRRMGNVVGQKAGNGEYKISAYQPNVSNPRTVDQQVQRSKFSFLGKLAVILGNDAIVGLSNTKYRTTQLAFISRNMPAVRMNVLGDPTTVNPTLTLPRVQLSDGGVITPNPDPVATGVDTFDAKITTIYGIDAQRPTSVVLVAMCLGEVERVGYRASVLVADYTNVADGVASASVQGMRVDIGTGATPAGGHQCVLFAYNVRVPLSSYRTHYGSVQAVELDGEPALAAVDTVKDAGGRALYSKTVSTIFNLEG